MERKLGFMTLDIPIDANISRFLLRALIATVVVLVAPNDAASQFAVHRDHVFLVDEEVPSVLQVTDMASGRQRELYRTESGRIFDFKVSPTGSMIAVTAQLLEYDVDPQVATANVHNRMVLEKITLHIIGVAGNEIDAIDDVRQFSWSPDGRQLGMSQVTIEVVTKIMETPEHGFGT